MNTRKSLNAGQRERLLDGMAQAVARRGYADASIAQAIAHAGVSRSTFYEHFADKQECFLAAFGELAPVLAGELLEAVRDVEWAEKPRAMLGVVLDPEQSETALHWRVLLTQSRAGEGRVRAERERFAGELERALEALLDAPPPQAPTLDIPPKALLGGARSAISIGRVADSGTLLDELVAWARSYTVPAGYERRDSATWARLGRELCASGLGDTLPKNAAPGPIAPDTAAATPGGGDGAGGGETPERRRLPRGRSRLPANLLASEHHARIVAATASVVREKGYAAATIADIVASAGTSRGVFYSQFQNKQEAFLAAQTAALQRGLTGASKAFFTGRSWPEQVWNGLDALLGYLATVPDLAHLMLIEPYAAGRAALERVIDTMRTLTLFLEEGYHRRAAASEPLPRTCSDAIAGAIHELLYHAAACERIAQMRELLPQATYVALAPFLGAVEARELVDGLLDARRATPV